jgi:chemotaxis family two-component system response regulator Rcp1
MELLRSRPVRITTIEDNPADVQLLRMALNNAAFAYELTVITDGAAALTLFREMDPAASTMPDVVVLDLNLPKYDGLEILEVVRSNPSFGDIPIAVLSSSSSPREQARIQNFSRVKYMTKPSDLGQYLAIGQILRDFVKENRL